MFKSNKSFTGISVLNHEHITKMSKYTLRDKRVLQDWGHYLSSRLIYSVTDIMIWYVEMFNILANTSSLNNCLD